MCYVLFTVVCLIIFIKMASGKHESDMQRFRLCVPPCPRFITSGDAHSLCVACLGAEHARSALEGADCPHCVRLSMRTLRSRRALFEEGALTSVPRGSGPASAEAERRLKSWGSQMDLTERLETGKSFSPSSPARSSAHSLGTEARSLTVSSAPREGSAVALSSSEEEGGAIVDRDEAVDLPPQSVLFEELLEVVTRAVDKLNIEWPTESECQEHPKSKLDERFLCSRSPPPRRGLPFFPDLHTEVSRSWSKPYSARLFSPCVSHYSNVLGLNECGYGKIPRVEDTLASYLSPGGASSLKAPVLPTKPLRTSSALVGKAYTAAGQAGGCLHTMAVLQAYQADLLKEMDEGDDIKNDDIAELRRATDLSLRATKETARAIGRSMAALVATERHLWLTLSQISDKDRVFLLDAPILPSGLFGDAVNAVVDRFQEAKKQAAAFQRFLPCHSQSEAERWNQPQPCTSSSYREVQKRSIATRAPPQKERQEGGRRSRSRSSKEMTDLRTVIFNKKASAKKS